MIWTTDANDGRVSTCRISDGIKAAVWQVAGRGWIAEIGSLDDYPVFVKTAFEDESAAKAAVAHWIGRTMAQFSNALAQGFEQPDDGA